MTNIRTVKTIKEQEGDDFVIGWYKNKDGHYVSLEVYDDHRE